MSPLTKRLFDVSIIPCIAIALVCIATAVWGARADFMLFEFDGVDFGNKEIISFRQGWDFRVALVRPFPIFGLRSRVPTDEERAWEDRQWGRPNHWLRLPEFDFSLWWPFTFSVATATLLVVLRRSRPGRGFPIVARDE